MAAAASATAAAVQVSMKQTVGVTAKALMKQAMAVMTPTSSRQRRGLRCKDRKARKALDLVESNISRACVSSEQYAARGKSCKVKKNFRNSNMKIFEFPTVLFYFFLNASKMCHISKPHWRQGIPQVL